jgi:hypothetical protein
MTVAQTPTPVVTPTSTPIPLTPTPTLFYITTPMLSATPGCAAPLNMPVGTTAFVRGGVYVRNAATASSPWVNYYEEAVEVTIVGGPVCDGILYNWWQVRGPGNDGWVAEGVPGNYFIRVGALPAGSVCPTAATLTVGGRANTLRDLRVREQPNDTSLVLTVAPAGSLVEIVDGPECGGGYNWWQVRVVVVNVLYTGWAVDGNAGAFWLQGEVTGDTSVCAPPLASLAVGTQAYVDYNDHSPKSLRAAPDNEATLIASLLDGIGFEIIGGPICADSYNWWQVRILSRPDVSGWLAEGGPQGYWVTAIEDELNPIDIAPPYR